MIEENDAISKLMQAFEAFNKSADKLSIAYKQLINEPIINEYNLSSEFLTKTLQDSANGVIIIDKEGRITLFNQSAGDIIGVSSKDVLGSMFKDIFAIQNNTKNYQKSNDDGLNDTHIKTIENFEYSAYEQYTTKTLEMLNDITLNIAHLMRSPLSAIQIFAELLKQDLDNDKQSMIDDILASVYSLDAVLCNLLSFAQPINLCFQQIDIIDILEDSLSFAMPAINHHGILLEKQYDYNRLSCYGDTEHLKQVFLNLILNAIQAMPNGGLLYVYLGCDYDNKYINIEITDNGCGIPKEHKEKIFVPFFTTKEGGTGLGLSVVYKIIQAHHGKIQIKSIYGKGTTVSIKLPLEHK
ncbi:MAG: sensor histidine kinase [bacterium]